MEALICVLSLLAAPQQHSAVTLSFDFHGETAVYSRLAGETEQIEIVATAPDAPEPQVLRHTTAFLQNVQIALPRGRWSLSIDSSAFWSVPIEVDLSSEDATVEIDLWPAARLEGSLQVARGEEPPDRLSLFFRRAPGANSPERLSDGKAACPVEQERWQCIVPAGTLDLRFQTADTIPQFEWGLTMPPGTTKTLAPINLRRGEAIQGWTVTFDGQPIAPDAAVEVRPKLAGTLAPNDQARLKQHTRSAPINPRGFFQMTGIQPGDYVLTATSEGFAPSITTVRVLPQQVTEIANPPLIFELPHRLDVFISPPTDPKGEPWNLELAEIEQSIGSAVLTAMRQGRAALDGTWSIDALAPGKYYLAVREPTGGAIWSTQEVEIGETQSSLSIDLDIVHVEGTVTLGHLPMPAKIHFGGRFGGVKITAEADDEGRYQAVLPRQGNWRVDVDLDALGVKRSFPKVEISLPRDDHTATVDFDVPDTLVQGQIVDEEGQSLANAIVTLRPRFPEPGHVAQQVADDFGHFEFRGSPPGTAMLSASAQGNLETPVEQVEISERSPADNLRLIAREKHRVVGRVSSQEGPLVGAKVKLTSADVFSMFGETVLTDATGAFEASLPNGIQRVRVGVGAPGFAYRMLTVPVDDEAGLGLLLQQEAGSLTLHLPPKADDAPIEFPNVTIYHDTGQESLFWLVAWARLLGVENAQPGRFEIPSLEPGEYRACWTFVDPESSPSCASGYLAPHGTLTLSLPKLP